MMKEQKNILPENWVSTKIGEIAVYVQRGKSPQYTPFSELPVINQKCIRWRGLDKEHVKYIHPEQWNAWAEERFLKNGDILWNSTGTGTIGRACIYKESYFPKAVVDSHVTIVRLHKQYIIPEYVFYFIASPFVQKKIEEMQSGSTNQVELGRDAINETIIPLPPHNEQKRIVAKIEELFSELDKGIENLKIAREQLKVYRQAVLKHAFEGKFTTRWREQNKDLLESADQLLEHIKCERNKWLAAEVGKGNNEAKRLLSKLREFTFNKPEKNLPQGWQWTSFTEALQMVVDCHNKTAPYEDSGIYLVRTSNIREGKIGLKNDIRFVSESTYKFWSRRCPPEPGDILFSREAPMGEAAIIPHNTKVCMGQRIMLLRSFNHLLSVKYLLYSILSPEFQSRMMKSAIGTGVKHLRVGDVEKLVFPICSPQEQGEIVRYLDRVFSAIEAIEQDIEENLQKSEAMRQSILKKAFSGKLVAQDPDDEPASVLPERIRAEKETQKMESKKPKAVNPNIKQLDLIQI